MHECLQTHIQNHLPLCKHILSHGPFAFRLALSWMVPGWARSSNTLPLSGGACTELGSVRDWVASW